MGTAPLRCFLRPRPGSRLRFSDLFEHDVLGALPQRLAPQLAQLVDAIDDGGEMVSGQRPGLAAEGRRAIGDQDLGLADAAGIQEQLPGGGIPRRVLEADPDVEVAEGDPGRLPTPAGMDQPGPQGKHFAERGDRLGCRVGLQLSRKSICARGNLEHQRFKVSPITPWAGLGSLYTRVFGSVSDTLTVSQSRFWASKLTSASCGNWA